MLSVEIASKWRIVACSLQPEAMAEHLQDEIASQHAGNLQKQAFHMLEAWRDKHSCDASVNTMCEVLMKVDCRDAAEKVFGYRGVQQVYSQQRSQTNYEGLIIVSGACILRRLA